MKGGDPPGEETGYETGSPRQIRRATAAMVAGTALSRITGVARMFALAYALGFTSLADAYNLANTMPNIVHDLVIGGVLAATFVPVFVDRLVRRPREEAWEAISAVTSVALLVLAAASLVFLAAAPWVVDAVTVLIHGEHARLQRAVATELLRLFVPQLAAYGFISIATALLNTTRRFAAPTFVPVVNNLVLIAMLVSFGTVVHGPTLASIQAHRTELVVLGLGTTLGVVLQGLLLIPSLRRAGLELRWLPSFRHEAVRTVVRLSGWTLGFVLANQVALMVVLALAERVGPGALSSYTYAYTVFLLPYGVMAVSVMSAVTPELAAHWARDDVRLFRRRLATGLRSILAIILPAAAGEIVLARPLVAFIFGHGAGSIASTLPTAHALAMLALGLPGFCAFLYAVRVLQAIQDTRSAFWLYLLENLLNIVGAVILAGLLGLEGITLSISIAYTIAAIVAFAHLRSKGHGLDLSYVARPALRVVVATAALVVVAAVTSNLSGSQSALGLLGRVLLGVAGGAAAYALVATAGALISSRRRAGLHLMRRN